MLGSYCLEIAGLSCGEEREEIATSVQAVTIPAWAPIRVTPLALRSLSMGSSISASRPTPRGWGWEPPNARTLWVRPAPPLTPPGPWTDQTQYLVGSQVTFPDSTSTFQAIQQHVSQPDWTPPAAPTLWKCIAGLCKLQAPSACVLAKNPDGTFRAVFAFTHTTGQNIIAPVGPTNQFSPAPADRGQPRTIAVGGARLRGVGRTGNADVEARAE
jgi:hypothetical protein